MESLQQQFIKFPKYRGKSCGEKEFTELKLALQSFSESLHDLQLDDLQFNDNIRLYYVVVFKAASLRNDKVLFPILHVASPYFINIWTALLLKYRGNFLSENDLRKYHWNEFLFYLCKYKKDQSEGK